MRLEMLSEHWCTTVGPPSEQPERSGLEFVAVSASDWTKRSRCSVQVSALDSDLHQTIVAFAIFPVYAE